MLQVEDRPMWIPALAIDGEIIASGDVTGVLKVWSMRTDPAPLNDKCIATAKEHTDGITGLWLQGTRIISSSSDMTIKVRVLKTTQQTCSNQSSQHDAQMSERVD
jgi:WD40 repeat protein